MQLSRRATRCCVIGSGQIGGRAQGQQVVTNTRPSMAVAARLHQMADGWAPSLRAEIDSARSCTPNHIDTNGLVLMHGGREFQFLRVATDAEGTTALYLS